MAGLIPATHASSWGAALDEETWVPGTSPGMTGGGDRATYVPRVRVVADAFAPEAETAALREACPAAGALVSFVGLCRDEGGRLDALEIEAYPAMAEERVAVVAGEAAARWPLLGLVVVHRHGLIRPGEVIVLVAAASLHRRAAFLAAEFLMDDLKTSAPFWKREVLRGGMPGPWVEARAEDDDAAARWAARQ